MIDFEHMSKLIDSIIPKLEFDIDRERSSAEKMTTVITGMPHGSGGNRSVVEDGAIKISELMDAYRESLSELESMSNAIAPIVDQIDDVNIRAVMRMRYNQFHSIDQVAEGTKYSIRHVYRLLEKGESFVNEKMS